MINKELSFFSPAKANLFFRVVNRRDDGYHHIQSLIQMLDFGDTLFFSLNTSCDKFTTTVSYLAWNQDNLIFKAVELFRKTTGIFTPLHIHLEKNIPSQAGLGGGSSNAATTLYALNQLFDTQFSDEKLASLGANLGADIPCFFGLGRVYVEGIGEKLYPVAPLIQEYTIVMPKDLSLSTPVVYKNVDLSKCSAHTGQELLQSFERCSPLYINDLEHAAFSLQPELYMFKQKLYKPRSSNVVMTGSGSAFLVEGKLNFSNPLIFSKVVKSLYRLQSSWYTKD